MTVDEIYSQISNTNYCITAIARKQYLMYFKSIIEKYLADVDKNYIIQISTTAKKAQQYKNMWPMNDKLQYVDENFLPPNTNSNLIYINDTSSRSINKDVQIELDDLLTVQPNIKYIYTGSTRNLLPYILYKHFRYYFHFQICKGRYSWLRTGINLNHKVSSSYRNKYLNQQKEKQNATKPMFLYDYFIFHDIIKQSTTIIDFNQRTYKPKKKPVANTPAINGTTSSAQVITKIVTKYIYVNDHNNSQSLVMPDGSHENYKSIVDKYDDIVEI